MANSSRVRGSTVSAFECGSGSARFSSTTTSTPAVFSSAASQQPTGPPPETTTSQSANALTTPQPRDGGAGSPLLRSPGHRDPDALAGHRKVKRLEVAEAFDRRFESSARDDLAGAWVDSPDDSGVTSDPPDGAASNRYT